MTVGTYCAELFKVHPEDRDPDTGIAWTRLLCLFLGFKKQLIVAERDADAG
jgi:hypothetical protein